MLALEEEAQRRYADPATAEAEFESAGARRERLKAWIRSVIEAAVAGFVGRETSDR